MKKGSAIMILRKPLTIERILLMETEAEKRDISKVLSRERSRTPIPNGVSEDSPNRWENRSLPKTITKKASPIKIYGMMRLNGSVEG